MTDDAGTGSDSPPVTHRSDYPNVAEWLAGADPKHWWIRLLDTERDPEVTSPTPADMTLGPLELLIRVVRDANPKNLGLFISSRFRDSDPANILSARLELLSAANLAVIHVPFAFGGKGEADLALNLGTSKERWLEIHRGAFNVFDDLQRQIEKELDEKNATLAIGFEVWPLEVKDRNTLHSRISKAIDEAATTGIEQRIPTPELGDGAGAVVRSGNGIGFARITIQHGGFAPSEIYLSSLARRLAYKVNVDKAGQARKGSWSRHTVLLIDISTAHLAQLLGQDALGLWLNEVPFEWDDLPFAGVAVSFSHLHGLLMFPGLCRYRPELAASDRVHLEPVLSAIGLQATN